MEGGHRDSDASLGKPGKVSKKKDRKRVDGDEGPASLHGRRLNDDDKRRRRDSKRRTRSRSDDDVHSVGSDDRRNRRKKASNSKRHKKRSRKSCSSESETSTSTSDADDQIKAKGGTKAKVANEKLLEKLSARGETLEEREERRATRRAAKITAKFGYTADENPFNDPNLHTTFTWKKKDEKVAEKAVGNNKAVSKKNQYEIFEEIEKVRRRRQDREKQFEEMERIRAEESRMKELENYDDWARKEEEFHLQQQRQRSAIRLVEGREKPIDVLAKNLLMFGFSDEEKLNNAAVKYQERYNALNELEALEVELEEPHNFLTVLKLQELDEVLIDINAFRTLERDASGELSSNENSVLKYWDALHLVAEDEIKFLRSGGSGGSHAQLVGDIRKLFHGLSLSALMKMQTEAEDKVRKSASGAAFGSDGGVMDRNYWATVLEQLNVHLAKMELSQIHSQMLVRQLEKLEDKKEELKKKANDLELSENQKSEATKETPLQVPQGVTPEFGNLDEELGLSSEVELVPGNYTWQDKFRPRKPRYFNRVKTGYDWNKYNQTHFDHDNPPPKIVQGYKFNIFYPDLVDPTKTPQFFLEPADTDEFCILRFHAGPPYEDIAFKIVNREWNRSRKRGFRSTFERGVLSLYFNFTSFWYRR